MKFIAVDDPQDPWDEILTAVGGDTVAMTAEGKPIALAVELQDREDPCELERRIRLTRSQQAVARTRYRTTLSRGVGDFHSCYPIDEDEADLSPTVRRLSGIASGKVDEADYHRRRIEKHSRS